MMDRAEILTTMAALKLFGMKAGYDEIVAAAVKREHEPQRIIGDLLAAELSESEPANATGSRERASARSIKYQMTITRMPFAKGEAGQAGLPVEGPPDERRVRLRGRPDQRDPGAGPRGRRLP